MMQISTAVKKLRLSIHAVAANGAAAIDWGSEALDAAIVAGITFFGALGGMTVVDIPTAKAVVAAAIAAGTQFFTVLGLKRGLVKRN